MHNYVMYIVAIGWLYVTALVALNEASVVAGIVSFLFYGLLPCALLLWLGGSRARRQRQRYREPLLDLPFQAHARLLQAPRRAWTGCGGAKSASGMGGFPPIAAAAARPSPQARPGRPYARRRALRAALTGRDCRDGAT